MYLHEEHAKELKSIIRKNTLRIWITAIIITTLLIWGEAKIGGWLLGLFGIRLSIGQLLICVILTNFIVGFIKVLWPKKK